MHDRRDQCRAYFAVPVRGIRIVRSVYFGSRGQFNMMRLVLVRVTVGERAQRHGRSSEQCQQTGERAAGTGHVRD